jgi:hypothetical protein
MKTTTSHFEVTAMEQQTLMQPSELQKTILLKALKLLTTAGVKHAVIDFDGVKHGDLEVAEPASGRQRGPNKTPRGTLMNYVQPYMTKLEVNEMIEIPATEEFPLSRLQSSVSSLGYRTWGEGSVMSHQNHTNNTLEVARLS